MLMEMGLLRVSDESGCKGLLQWRRKCLAVRYRHMSLFVAVTSAYRPQIRYNNRLQSSGGGGVGPGALSLPCTPLLLLILHAIEFCACGLWSYFSFSKAPSGSRRKPDSNGLLKAACKSRRDVQWRERVGTAVCRQEFRCNFQTETVVNSLGGG